MFSVQAERTVSGGFRGNYVASVAPLAPECLQGLQVGFRLHFVRPPQN